MRISPRPEQSYRLFYLTLVGQKISQLQAGMHVALTGTRAQFVDTAIARQELS